MNEYERIHRAYIIAMRLAVAWACVLVLYVTSCYGLISN